MAITRLIFTVYILLLFSACQASGIDKSEMVDFVKSDLVTYLYSKYSDFQVTEIYSKNDNKKSFLKSSLSEGFIANVTHIASKELYFKDLAKQTASHIGIACVIYIDEASAKRASKKLDRTGYFSNTKILTKYITVNLGKENLVVYSESSADKVVSSFFNRLKTMKQGK
jgi:hypothetical protein